MAVSASIKFTQGPNTDIPGRAVVGTLTDGAVTITNGNDTGVVFWEYELLYVPPGSAIPVAVLSSGGIPSANFTQPDVPGLYRVRLEVRGSLPTDTATDVRCFGVPNAAGWLIPPYQGSGNIFLDPDEVNFGGQQFGWAGYRQTGLLETILEDIGRVVTGPWKIPVRLASDGTNHNIAVGGNQVIDTMLTNHGDPVLLKDQITLTENGPYIVNSAGAWTRMPGVDASGLICPGLSVYVANGLNNKKSFWTLTNLPPLIIGVTAFTFENILSASAFVGTPTHLDKNQTPLATVGNFQNTGIALSANPTGNRYPTVNVNGISYPVGNGTRLLACYFSNDGGATARSFSNLVAGDVLYWNGLLSVPPFNLTVTDVIDIDYDTLTPP